MDWFSAETLIALGTLTFLEIILGVDNIIFISILAGKLPSKQQPGARRVGLLLAMGTRILLLFSLAWVVKLTAPLFALWSHEISGRDLILILGGLFLLFKSTHEIHGRLEGDEGEASTRAASSFTSVLVQIALLDIVFSLDSVITAVGMVDQIGVMVAAVIASVAVMLFAAKPIGEFVDRHPSVKVLALAFLVMVGMALTAEAFDVHVPKGYIYAAMAFALTVEMLNLRARARAKRVAKPA